MGYKTVMPIQLANLMHAHAQGMITHAGVRCYFGLLEMQSIREAATRSVQKQGRLPSRFYRFKAEELAELTGLAVRKVRAAVKSLKQSGVVAVDIRKISFNAVPISGSEKLLEELRCHRSARRPIPIPRNVLVFLAKESSVGLTGTMVGYMLRGLSIDRRSGDISSRGTVKASWIAKHLNLSDRAVKYAQARLREMGWIGKDTQSYQRKLNRTGAYFEIDSTWTGVQAPGAAKLAPIGGASVLASQPEATSSHTTAPIPIGNSQSRPSVPSTIHPSNQMPGIELVKNPKPAPVLSPHPTLVASGDPRPTITQLPIEEPQDLPMIQTGQVARNLVAQLQAARRINAERKARGEVATIGIGEITGSPPRTSAKYAPLPPKICTLFAPPIEKDQRTERSNNQRAGCGFQMKEAGGGKPAPSWRSIRLEDLHDRDRLEQLFEIGVESGIVTAGEASHLNLFSAAIRAREVGDDPVRLFVGIVRRKLWHHITNAQEDRATRWMKGLENRCRFESSTQRRTSQEVPSSQPLRLEWSGCD